MREKVVLSWSGGKDSSMALHALLRDERYEVVGLLTTVAAEYKRISRRLRLSTSGSATTV